MYSKTLDLKFSEGLLDFHTHTTRSDGGDTPTQLVERAREQGVSAMALTDHNVISGLEELNVACKEAGIFAIPFGTEIYAELPSEILTPEDNDAPDLVILGKNPKPQPIDDYHTLLSRDRKERWFPETIKALENLGFVMPPYNLDEQCQDLGVPRIFHDFIHYRDNMERLFNYLQETGAEIKGSPVKREELEKQPIRFVNRFIYSIGKPGYVKRIAGFTVQDAIQLAEAMNSKIFIAHPGGEYGFLSDKVLDHYVNSGVHGIETRNYFNTPEQNAKFDKLAEENQLIRTGGSDCHGNNGPFKIGMYDRPQNQVPKDVLEELWFNLPE